MEKIKFQVGAMATDTSFLGRTAEVKKLSDIFIYSKSVHLIGAARIGKSSLSRRVFEKYKSEPGIIQLELCLSEFPTAYDFWISFSSFICEALQEHGICGTTFERYYERLGRIDGQRNWYTAMATSLKGLLKELKKTQYRLVVSVDEFDAATRVFAGESAYYQLLRSLFSDANYAMNGVIISRRTLQVLEAKCPDISTFHGVFDTQRLREFDVNDMAEFYEALSAYGISLDDDAKRRLAFYTGSIPYLCCMFADRMVQNSVALATIDIQEADIQRIYKQIQPDIESYYDDLIMRLEEDNHLEPIMYLAFDEMRTSSYERNRNSMIAMGYLTETIENNENVYFAYSRDFMSYLRYKPTKLSTWKLMTTSEKILKSVFRNEYPLFEEVIFDSEKMMYRDDTKKKISENYSELLVNWLQIESYAKSLATRKSNPTVLDVLTLGYIVGIIITKWKHFGKYFNYDEGWKGKLDLLRNLRNPLAHAQDEYITDEEISKCNRYCQELIILDTK